MIKSYTLIHGAWHGSWCFSKYIVPSLNKIKGVGAYACDLPGHYKNKSYDFKDITLDTYVNYVTDHIKNNVSGQTILVGHSMGGVVISQVAEKIPEKISNLVYISAFVPSKNGSLLDEEKKAINPSVALKVKIDENHFSIRIDKKDAVGFFYPLCKEEDVEYATALLQEQPLLPFGSKVSLGRNFESLPKTYIECLKDKAISIEDQRRMNEECDNIVSIDADHSPFFSSHEELTEILGDIGSSDLQ